MSRTVPQLFDLTEKIALVTGGAGHLGTAMSEALAEAGASVAVASRNLDNCRALAGRLGTQHLGLKLDINSEESLRETVNRTAQHFGRLDVLVNCASSGPPTDLDEATGDEFDKALHLSITAYFIASQQAARQMKQSGGGSINQIASMYGVVSSYPDVYIGSDINSPPTYHAGKGGVVHLTRYLAVHWARDNIRVNALSPGPFPRPGRFEAQPEFYEKLKEKVPMYRFGEPWELKGAIVFLASQASSFMTGQNLLVDGGWTAW